MDKTYYVVELTYGSGSKKLVYGYNQRSPKLYARKSDATRTAHDNVRYGQTRVIPVKLVELDPNAEEHY